MGIPQLKRHIESSLREVTADNDREAIQRYERMMETVAKPTIPCLAMVDSGTTGLQGNNWRNLIFREGTPTNAEGQTKGGSYGFGKNAPFNLSCVQHRTVQYALRERRKERKSGTPRRTLSVGIPRSSRLPERPARKEAPANWLLGSPFGNSKPTSGRSRNPASTQASTSKGLECSSLVSTQEPTHTGLRKLHLATVTQFFYAIHTRKLVVIIEEAPARPHG